MHKYRQRQTDRSYLSVYRAASNKNKMLDSLKDYGKDYVDGVHSDAVEY